MPSTGIMFIPSFMKICHLDQKLLGQTHFIWKSFLFKKESSLKTNINFILLKWQSSVGGTYKI